MAQFNQFVSAIKSNGVAKSSHYFCDIIPPRFMMQTATPIKDTIPFYVEGVSIPEFALATQTIKDAGLNRESVYDKMYGTVTMTMFSDQNMSIKKFFDDWAMAPVMSKGGVFMYPESYIAETLAIYNIDNSKNVTYVTILNNVYPKVVDDVILSADSKAPLSFRVQFTYESWDSYQFQRTDPNAAVPGDGLVNIRRAWDLIQLVRTGANKDAIKSLIINVGTRKIYDVLGKSGIADRVGQSIDSVLGSTGIGGAIGQLKGIIL